ncbi:hypothetical protein P3T43_004190 [Paraburkholderia sp. GAS41]|jgi:hypothetical protein
MSGATPSQGMAMLAAILTRMGVGQMTGAVGRPSARGNPISAGVLKNRVGINAATVVRRNAHAPSAQPASISRGCRAKSLHPREAADAA